MFTLSVNEQREPAEEVGSDFNRGATPQTLQNSSATKTCLPGKGMTEQQDLPIGLRPGWQTGLKFAAASVPGVYAPQPDSLVAGASLGQEQPPGQKQELPR